jgi:hypothetical protein
VVLSGSPFQSNWGSASSNISRVTQISAILDSSARRHCYLMYNVWLRGFSTGTLDGVANYETFLASSQNGRDIRSGREAVRGQSLRIRFS